jgi:large subunit ribosomal protein L5
MAEKDRDNMTEENAMRKIKIDKVVLSMGGKGEDVEKGYKLLKIISGRKPSKATSNKRIPSFAVRPGLEVGVVVTIRNTEEIEEIVKRMLAAIENQLKRKQIADGHFTFGIQEYIEIPGVEYQRDIGMMGLDFTVTFARTGKRVKLRKVKRGKFHKKQMVSKDEIIKFMEDKFGTEFVGK